MPATALPRDLSMTVAAVGFPAALATRSSGVPFFDLRWPPRHDTAGSAIGEFPNMVVGYRVKYHRRCGP
jgi:hypothetical protein